MQIHLYLVDFFHNHSAYTALEGTVPFVQPLWGYTKVAWNSQEAIQYPPWYFFKVEKIH